MTTDGSQEFCLRWNNHQATIISVFDYLLENETLVDCTLAAEGQYLKAHKVVLCACSPYLELLLSQHNDKHPILIFKDIKFNELKSMIDYMYKGEVNIAQDQLNHFLKAAESLQIKGLSESEDDATPQTATPTPRPPPPRAPPAQRTQPRPFNNAVAIRSTGPSDVDPDSPKRIIGRPEAQSPTPRKRRRQAPVPGRPSLSGDDASNASEGHFDQSNCDVPTPAHSTSTSLVPSGDSEKAVAKVETNSELMLEPKTEYDDNSVEDITLDDDDEDYSQAGTSQMDNSQGNFGNWQQMVGDQTGDDVFSGQDTGAQNSQELMIECKYCNQKLANYLDILLGHSNSCPSIKDAKRDKVSHMCCRCSFSSASNENLKIHLKSHFDEKMFRCPLCSFGTALIGSLKLHIMKDHVSLNPLSCPLCGYVCKKPNGLSIHMKSHVQDIADFKVPVMKQIPGVSSNCTNKIKSEDFPELAKLSDQNDNPVNVSTMKIETALTPDTMPEKKQKLKHMTSPLRLKQHKKLSLLMKKADRSVLLEKQRKGIRMDKISCKYCSKKVIRDVNKIHEHSMKCPNMEKTNKKSFMCCSCDYSSSYLGLLNTHILTVHSRIEDKPHKCDLCEFRTAYSQSLVIHFRTHTGEKPFECSACNFKCTTSSSLKSHVKIHHEKTTRGEKLISTTIENKQLHSCNYCAFKAKKLGTLNRHVNSQHPQYKHLEATDQSSIITEMLQIEMNTNSVPPVPPESEVKYHPRSSEEKTSFFQFLNLETRTSKQPFSNNETALNLSHHQDSADPSVNQ